MMALHDFPRCSAYLKAMRFRLDDPAMTDYGWAVALSENWTDEFLVKDGRVDFATMGGSAILTEFERLFQQGTATGGKHAQRNARRYGLSPTDMDSLRAFFGSRGVKASTLRTDDDFWTVAHILWPLKFADGERGALRHMLNVLRSMTKKQRAAARANVVNVPARYLPTNITHISARKVTA